MESKFGRSLTSDLKQALATTTQELETKYRELMDLNRLYVGARGGVNGS